MTFTALDSMGKTVDVLKKYNVDYILTGHTPYPIVSDYAAIIILVLY